MFFSLLLKCRLFRTLNSYKTAGDRPKRPTYGRMQIFTWHTNSYIDIGFFNLRQLRRKSKDTTPKYKILFFIKTHKIHLIIKTPNLLPASLRVRYVSMQSNPIVDRILMPPKDLVTTWRAWCWDTYLDFYYFSDPMWARAYALYRRKYTSRYCNRTPRPFTRPLRILTIPQQRAKRVVLALFKHLSGICIFGNKVLEYNDWWSADSSVHYIPNCPMDISKKGLTRVGCPCFIRAGAKELSVLSLALLYRDPPRIIALEPLWNCYPRKQTRTERLDYAFKARQKATKMEVRLNSQLRREAKRARSLETRSLKITLKESKKALLHRQLLERQELAMETREALQLLSSKPLGTPKASDSGKIE